MLANKYDGPDIPEGYKEQFERLLAKMSEETGGRYKVEVHQWGCVLPTPIGKYGKKIEVYEMKKDFEQLNGVYANKKEFKAKIKQFIVDEFYSETKSILFHERPMMIGKCRKCDTYHENQQVETTDMNGMKVIRGAFPNDISGGPNCCRQTSKWCGVWMANDDREIFWGSCNIKEIGFYRFIE